ncbi:hypothetical protein A2U01_0075388, partial [Trifolium medium]|nr:hypothetical protein [Trifolium medium]
EAKLKENAAAQGERISKLTKEKEEAVSTAEALGKEKTQLESDIHDLQLSAALQYD